MSMDYLNYRHRSKLWNEATKKYWACQQELADLETRAGIARFEYEAFGFLREPNWFHDRELYFAVRDVKLRKALISKYCEVEDLLKDVPVKALADARIDLDAVQAPPRWWIGASVGGIAAIALGYQFFGLAGALGGLLVGYFAGRYAEQEEFFRRDRAIAEEKRRVEEAEETLERWKPFHCTFSSNEVYTGKPDPEEVQDQF